MSAELLEYRHALPGGEYMADPDADQNESIREGCDKGSARQEMVESRSDIGKNAVELFRSSLFPFFSWYFP